VYKKVELRIIFGLQWCVLLFLFEGDVEFAMKCHQAFLRGQQALDHFLWNETAQYYNAYSTMDFDYESFVQATGLEVCSYPESGRRTTVSSGAQETMCVEGNPATPGAIMADSFYSQV